MRRVALVAIISFIVRAQGTELKVETDALSDSLSKTKLEAEELPATTPDPLARERDDLEAAAAPSREQLEAAALSKQSGGQITGEQLKRLQSDPEAQAMMKGMTAMMQSEEFQTKMKKFVQEDDDIRMMIEDIQAKANSSKGLAGIQDVMKKYYSNKTFIKKFSGIVGDLPAQVMEAAGSDPKAIQAATGYRKGQQDADEKPHPFLMSAKKGNMLHVKKWIENGTDISMADADGRTAMHFAAGMGNDEIVQILIDNGANPLATDSTGNAPLHYAAGYGRGPVVKVLLNAGATPTSMNRAGQTPKDVAELNPRNEILKNKFLMSRLCEQGMFFDGMSLAEASPGRHDNFLWLWLGLLGTSVAVAFAFALRPRSRPQSAQEPFLVAV